MDIRIETDGIGSMGVPARAYYGIQSLRAKNNFNITGRPLHPVFIKNLIMIKKAAAITNMEANQLDRKIGRAMVIACDEIIEGKFLEEFIVDSIQGGAGTSANMNANEVIANRGIELLGGVKGDYGLVHPNDHVNMAQSTNDVIPSAGKLTILELLPKTIKELCHLKDALTDKSIEFRDILKLGRTQLQDAVPMYLGQSFKAYQAVVERDIKRLNDTLDDVNQLNMGGTAIGTGINTSPYYFSNIVPNINRVCGTKCTQGTDLIDSTQNLDGFVQVSASLKICALNLSKICNDLRLLSSGPRTGLFEINLPPMQNGSSIMPGKVNPVIPEVVNQVAFLIAGNDLTISMAAEAGQLELNAFEPVLFYNLFESIDTLKGAVKTLTDNCVSGITVNKDRCNELLNNSVGISTALCPYIGYQKAATLAKKSLATNIPLKELVLAEGLLEREEIEHILNPTTVTNPVQFEEKYLINL